MEILYTGLEENTLQSIKDALNRESADFISYDDTLTGTEKINFRDKGAFLLGNNVKDPIRMAQKVYSLDKNLSILIILDEDKLKDFKKELQFTPFIGNTVKCLSQSDSNGLIQNINEEIDRTFRRRDFETLKKSGITLESSFHFDAVKRKYIDKFFEQAPIGAILLDYSGTVLAMNPYAINQFHSEDIRVQGTSIFEYFKDIDKSILSEFLHGSDGESKVIELNSKDKQYLELRVKSIEQKFNLLLINDITAIKKAEEKIKIQVSDLESLNQNLVRVNNDLDTFIYTASHDLKAPVSNIEGLFYSLFDILDERKVDGEEIGVIRSMILNSVMRFKDTIMYLTDIVKVQRNFDETKESIDVLLIISEILEDLDSQIKEVKAKIHLDLDIEYRTILFSRSNIKSIFYNLISNAIKYKAPDRAPLINISSSSDGQFLHVRVQDNGLGLSASSISKLFGMFKRFHTHVEGTGIGLYLVKRIIDNVGGRIDVSSELGQGTVFNIYFPLK